MKAGRWLAALALGLLAVGAAAQPSPSPFTYGTRYDAMARVTGTIAPDPDGAGPLGYAAVRNTYDSPGRITKVEKGQLTSWQSDSVAPSAWTGFTVLESFETIYDAMGRKVRDTAKGSDTIAVSVTQYSYDTVGQLQCTAVRMNPAVYGSLPTSACTLGTAGTNGPDRITKNVYDAAGQLTQVREGVGSTIEAAEVTNSYTANGKRDYIIDGEGARARFVYDGHDRVSQWQFPSTTRPSAYNDSTPATALASAGAVNTADYEQYGYDLASNRTSLRKRDTRVIGYSYDALNRVSIKDIPSSTTLDVYYGYDLRNLQTYARFGSTSGQGVTQSYDGFGRLTSSSIDQGGTTRTIAHQYDADGNRTRITWPDSQYVTFDYDGLDRLTTVKESGATTIASYAYNDRTDVSARTNGGESSTYGYDPVGRVSSIAHDLATAGDVTLGFTAYNPASQLLTRTVSNDAYAWTAHANANRAYVSNGLNQYASVGGTAYAYDANGNLTSDGATTYTYDVENRLTGASGAKVAGLVYDPLGRLFETSAAGGAGMTRFLYDGDELIAEYDSGGTLLRRYAHGSGTDDPIVWYEGATLTTRRHLIANEQGSPIAIADAAGTLIQANAWDEYGVPNTANLGRFGYTGQIWLPEVGCYHYKARLYCAFLGRFLQVDPVGYDDQINLYAYVANDPVNRSDPTGKQSVQDQQLQMQIDDMRQQGMSEKQIQQEIGRQAGIEATALSVVVPVEGLAVKGLGLLGRVLGVGERAAVNIKTGLTVTETKAVAGFFGKGADGAKAAIESAGKPGFALPKGVTEGTLTKYREVAVKAIEAGKPAEVQKLRIEAIDKSLEALKRNQ